MTAPNRSTLWGRIIVDELAKSGLEAVCLTPGSRSTPLTVACVDHPELTVYSHLDERASAFFALGHARRTGQPTALVCTSGTAAANFHPAVIEADTGRVPLVVLTADRPRELRESGANQTIDQVDLYGEAVRTALDLPEPRDEKRTKRSLRRSVCVAVGQAIGPPAGPVHLNCPFAKPLEPLEVPGDDPAAVHRPDDSGRDGPFVTVSRGTAGLGDGTLERVASLLEAAARPLIVAGPADRDRPEVGEVLDLAETLGCPVFADPLSGVRFQGGHSPRIYGGYDTYVSALEPPDVVLRFGAAPTSKSLATYLETSGATQLLIDPAGEWREATFTATDLLVASPDLAVEQLADRIESGAVDRDWAGSIERAESVHWSALDDALEPGTLEENPFEGAALATVFDAAPDPATIVVSNSMPVRDADRFARPREADLTVLGNRGASGIDGVTSTALGAGSATDDPLVLVIGDLAFYHDATGLLAANRCGIDATIVLLDNDGGGIFHMLPIEDVDPPFTEHFKTPHGLPFDQLTKTFGLEYDSVVLADFEAAYRASLESNGTQVIRVGLEAAASHARREELERAVTDTLDRSGS